MLFNTLLLITSLCQWHYLICIIDEITDILGIRVFRVKPKGKPVGPSPASVPLLQQASEAIPK